MNEDWDEVDQSIQFMQLKSFYLIFQSYHVIVVALLKEKRINVGFVDSMTSDGQKLVDSYGIKMFPTVYIFGREKDSPIKYPFSKKNTLMDLYKLCHLAEDNALMISILTLSQSSGYRRPTVL